MITQTVATITLTGGGTYTFPSSFTSLDQVVYTSSDGSVYNPTFADYTLANKAITIPAAYSGTFDLYYSYGGTDTGSGTSGGTMTQDDMILLTAKYCNVQTKVVKTGLPLDYNGTAAIITSIFRDGFNEAKDELSKKLDLTYTESVVLDGNLMFSISGLSKTYLSIIEVNGGNTYFDEASATQIICPNNKAGDTVSVKYRYLPNSFVSTDLTATLDIPVGLVHPRVLCYFAAYMYFKTQGSDRQGEWLELWNNAYDNLKVNRVERTQIQDYYGFSLS